VADPKKPTEGELAILRVLWSRGAGTVRDVAEAMGRGGAYTTILKLMQIMTDKGLIRRDDSARAHVYEAAYSEDHTQRQLVRDLLDRLFDGSPSRLVMHALAAKPASADELKAIRRLLAEARPKRKPEVPR
jgi:BlaI family transcriptional regulator, penicillinase repressor